MMIDVNASVGHWPFGDLSHATAAGLVAWMNDLGIEQACVAPLEGLFYRPIDAANRKLFHAIRNHRDRLLPIAVIDPNFPGWQDDLTACIRQNSPAGIRLFPGYHGYNLTDPCCLELLADLEHRGLPVQIAPAVTDWRMHHPRAVVKPASAEKIGELVRRFPRLNIGLLNVNATLPIIPNPALLRKAGNFFIDLSWSDGVACVESLIRHYGLDALLFGTNSPLMYPLSVVYKLREADLDKTAIRNITRANARRFLRQPRSARSRT